MRFVFALKLPVFLATCAFCAKIVHTSVYSEAMQQEIPTSFVFPDAYFANRTDRFPVVYGLNGYSANNTSMF